MKKLLQKKYQKRTVTVSLRIMHKQKQKIKRKKYPTIFLMRFSVLTAARKTMNFNNKHTGNIYPFIIVEGQ